MAEAAWYLRPQKRDSQRSAVHNRSCGQVGGVELCIDSVYMGLCGPCIQADLLANCSAVVMGGGDFNSKHIPGAAYV